MNAHLSLSDVIKRTVINKFRADAGGGGRGRLEVSRPRQEFTVRGCLEVWSNRCAQTPKVVPFEGEKTENPSARFFRFALVLSSRFQPHFAVSLFPGSQREVLFNGRHYVASVRELAVPSLP